MKTNTSWAEKNLVISTWNPLEMFAAIWWQFEGRFSQNVYCDQFLFLFWCIQIYHKIGKISPPNIKFGKYISFSIVKSSLATNFENNNKPRAYFPDFTVFSIRRRRMLNTCIRICKTKNGLSLTVFINQEVGCGWKKPHIGVWRQVNATTTWKWRIYIAKAQKMN